MPFVAAALVGTGTIFYILTGIGVFVALLASIAQQYIAQKTKPLPCGSACALGHHDGS